MELAHIDRPAAVRSATLLSVVIPARKEGSSLPWIIEQMLAAVPLAGEIIVIDNGARDRYALQLAFARLNPYRLEQVLEEVKRNGGSAARWLD